MKRRHLNTFLMLVGLVGLAGWYFFYELNYRWVGPFKFAVSTEESADEAKKRLITIDKTKIEEITVKKAGAEANAKLETVVALRKVGTKWGLTFPIEYPGDDLAIGAMATTLGGLKYEGVVEEGAKDLEKYGLKSPKLTVQVTDDSKKSEEVQFGADTPVGGAVYVKTGASNTVYRVSTYVKAGVDKAPKDLRDRALLNLARVDLGELDVQNTKGSFILAKNEKDQWLLARENLAVDVNEANRFINSVLEARAVDFIDGKAADPAKFGLANPKIKIVLAKSTDKTKVSLFANQVGDKYYAKLADKNVIFEMSKDFWGRMDIASATLRTKEVASFSRSDIQRIRLERGKESIEFYRTNSEWEIPSEPKTKIDSLKVDGWLTSLQDLKVDRYADRKGKLPSSQFTIRLMQKKDDKETEKLALKIGPAKEGLVGIERTGYDMVFFVKEADFKKLDLKKSDFLKSEKPAEPAKESQKSS